MPAIQKNKSDKDKSGKGNNSRGWTGDIRFINVNLSDSQKLAYAKWITDSPDATRILDETIAGGYKLSVGYDDKQGAYMATLTNRGGDPTFVNSCFTLRARNAWEAVVRVLWLHAIFAEGDWNAFAEPDMDQDLW